MARSGPSCRRWTSGIRSRQQGYAGALKGCAHSAVLAKPRTYAAVLVKSVDSTQATTCDQRCGQQCEEEGVPWGAGKIDQAIHQAVRESQRQGRFIRGRKLSHQKGIDLFAHPHHQRGNSASGCSEGVFQTIVQREGRWQSLGWRKGERGVMPYRPNSEADMHVAQRQIFRCTMQTVDSRLQPKRRQSEQTCACSKG